MRLFEDIRSGVPAQPVSWGVSNFNDMWGIGVYPDGSKIYFSHLRDSFPMVLIRRGVKYRLAYDNVAVPDNVYWDFVDQAGDYYGYLGEGKFQVGSEFVNLEHIKTNYVMREPQIDSHEMTRDELIEWAMMLGRCDYLDSIGGRGMTRQVAEKAVDNMIEMVMGDENSLQVNVEFTSNDNYVMIKTKGGREYSVFAESLKPWGKGWVTAVSIDFDSLVDEQFDPYGRVIFLRVEDIASIE